MRFWPAVPQVLPEGARVPLRLEGRRSQLRGLQQATDGKNTRSCEYSSEMSLPRKICAADSDYRAALANLGHKGAAGPQHVRGDVERLAT